MVSQIQEHEIIIGREFPSKVIPLINEAKRSIDVIVFDWRWYPQNPKSSVQLFNQSIVRAVHRGVVVRAISNNDQIHGILKEVGVKSKRCYSHRVMHIKLIIIDDMVVVVGSHNYTQNAFQMNHEISVILKNDSADNRFKKYFNGIYK